MVGFTIDSLGHAVAAAGALGTASFGIVEALKWTPLGPAGFGQIWLYLGAELEGALEIADGKDFARLLAAQYSWSTRQLITDEGREFYRAIIRLVGLEWVGQRPDDRIAGPKDGDRRAVAERRELLAEGLQLGGAAGPIHVEAVHHEYDVRALLEQSHSSDTALVAVS